MKYNRFAGIPGILTTPVFKEYELPKVQEPDVRIVNDAEYRPNKKAAEILAKNQALGMLKDMQFDSPEDIASGSVNVYARQKGRDMAELTQQYRKLEKQATDSLSEAVKAGARKRQEEIVAQQAAAEQSQQPPSE